MEDIHQNTESEYKLNIESVLREAFDIVKYNLTPVMFYTSLYLLITLLLVRYSYQGMVIQALITGPVLAGYYNAYRMSSNENPIRIADFFIVFQAPLYYLIAHIFTGIIIVAGIYLLIIPGIYFLVAYFFTLPFLINYKIGIWQAMESSRIIITNQFWPFLFLILILIAINILGALMFGVGLLISIPLTYASIHVAFRQMVPEDENKNEETDTSPDLNMFR